VQGAAGHLSSDAESSGSSSSPRKVVVEVLFKVSLDCVEHQAFAVCQQRLWRFLPSLAPALLRKEVLHQGNWWGKLLCCTSQ
jgi:hypothetical protein